MTSDDPIDIANGKSLDQFIEDYLPSSPSWKTFTHPQTHDRYTLCLTSSTLITPSDINTCFHLIEATSSAAYRNSKDGWRPRNKRTEMKLLDLKYILVKGGKGEVKAFLSLMPTWEDERRVVYCYEVHVEGGLQGSGLGTVLMNLLDSIAARIPETEKVMLTCFTSNVRGIKFYERLGFEKDEFSPPPKVLRNGTKVEKDYVILSKDVKR